MSNDRIFVITAVTLLSTSKQTKQNGHHECSVYITEALPCKELNRELETEN
jgi:predicted house-cleaning NTP pyrophosphatase (Maf/HAM1 superfamily)